MIKTIREGTAGRAKLRLVETDKGFVAIAIESGKTILQKEAASADEAWNALQMGLTREGPNWFGYAGARARFLHWFEGGFHSSAYLADERTYKLKAKDELEKTTPLEKAATGSGHGEAILRAYRATNLLYPIEKTRMQDLLRGSHADDFIRAAARFALGEGKVALRAMETLLRQHENAKWTVVTYLGYLWRPETHIFLKPEVTKDFAARVGHPLAHSYSSDLDYAVYQDLLDMAGAIRQALIDLEPRDMIDIQSVIWVVGDYRDGREVPQP